MALALIQQIQFAFFPVLPHSEFDLRRCPQILFSSESDSGEISISSSEHEPGWMTRSCGDSRASRPWTRGSRGGFWQPRISASRTDSSPTSFVSVRSRSRPPTFFHVEFSTSSSSADNLNHFLLSYQLITHRLHSSTNELISRPFPRACAHLARMLSSRRPTES